MQRMNDTVDAATLAYSRLEPEQIIAALEDHGYECDGRFLALNSYENRVYQVGIEGGPPVVAKFYRPARWSDPQILEEHEFALSLAAAELPVVPPLQHDGETLLTSGEFRFAVYESRGGRSPELDNYELQRQLGRFIARIHLIGETKNFATRPSIDIESYGTSSCDFLLDNELVPLDLEDAYESVAEQVLEGVEHSLARAGNVQQLRIHADFHPGNVLIAHEQIHIVDLDDTRHGPAVQDIWMFLSGDQTEQAPQLAALLEGYEEFRRFDARELHLIEALRSLRIMHYAAWLARRWRDPAFQAAFPWFASRRYWDDHVLALREQIALMQESPVEWRPI